MLTEACSAARPGGDLDRAVVHPDGHALAIEPKPATTADEPWHLT